MTHLTGSGQLCGWPDGHAGKHNSVGYVARRKAARRKRDRENREKTDAQKRKWASENPEKVKISRRKSQAKRRAQINAREREKRRTDPEYREKQNAKSRQWQATALRDPERREEYYAKRSEWWREAMKDPERRERDRALHRRSYAARKARTSEVNQRPDSIGHLNRAEEYLQAALTWIEEAWLDDEPRGMNRADYISQLLGFVMHLNTYADRQGRICVPLATLAANCDNSPSTVKRLRHRAEEYELIKRTGEYRGNVPVFVRWMPPSITEPYASR